jgi:hypothetical protein
MVTSVSNHRACTAPGGSYCQAEGAADDGCGNADCAEGYSGRIAAAGVRLAELGCDARRRNVGAAGGRLWALPYAWDRGAGFAQTGGGLGSSPAMFAVSWLSEINNFCSFLPNREALQPHLKAILAHRGTHAALVSMISDFTNGTTCTSEARMTEQLEQHANKISTMQAYYR